MKKTFFLSLLLLMAIATQSQSDYQTCIQLDPNKKDAYYTKNSKSAEKKGNLLNATIYAIYALEKADKKKRIQKAAERLANLLPNSVSSTTERINLLKENSKVVKGEADYRMRSEIRCLYGGLLQLKDSYASLSAEKLNLKNGPNLNLEIADYSNDYQAADESLSMASKEVAEVYFLQAKSIPPSAVRVDNLDIVKLCDRAMTFDKTHGAAQNLLQESLPNAIGRVVVMPVLNNFTAPGVEATKLRSTFMYSLEGGLKNEEYFDFVPATTMADRGNIVIKIAIETGSHQREKGEPSSEEKSKDIGTEEKPNVVKATYVSHHKSSLAKLTGSYVIEDLQTGQLLATGQIDSEGYQNYYWSSYSGNAKALSKKELKRVKAEPTWISPQGMYELAVSNLAKKIYSAVDAYFEEAKQPIIID